MAYLGYLLGNETEITGDPYVPTEATAVVQDKGRFEIILEFKSNG